MSAMGYAVVAMVIDFSGIDGTLVVAKVPSDDTDWAMSEAQSIFDKVREEYDADYDLHADGKFDTLAAIKKHLNVIGAEVITYEQEQYL
jgi:hypothetical protein